MFASRIAGDLAPNRLTETLRACRAEGRPIIDLTESNPTRVGLDYPADLLTRLADSRGLTYAPHPFGLLEARRAVARDYERRGVRVDPERLALTASTSEAYSLLFKLLAAPGDEILVPRPSYPLFDHLAALDGLAARPYELDYHGRWSIDFDTVDRAIGPRTRALLLVNPNNPTGSFVSPEELERLAAICAARRLALIADEVFADYDLESAPADRAPSVLLRDDVLVFGLGGLSKSVGLPQVKLGWIAIAGPAAIVSDAIRQLELMCDTYLSVSTPVQLAAGELLARGSVVREQIVKRLRDNHRRLKDLVAAVPSCCLLNTSGGWSAVLQVPTFRPEEDLVVDLLATDGVLVHPGYFFDFPRESFVIMSLLPATRSFEDGVARLLDRAARAA